MFLFGKKISNPEGEYPKVKTTVSEPVFLNPCQGFLGTTPIQPGLIWIFLSSEIKITLPF